MKLTPGWCDAAETSLVSVMGVIGLVRACVLRGEGDPEQAARALDQMREILESVALDLREVRVREFGAP